MAERPKRTVIITGHAERDIAHLSSQDQRRVLAAIDRLGELPPLGDIRKLEGSNEWRLRVGNVRVRFELADRGRAY